MWSWLRPHYIRPTSITMRTLVRILFWIIGIILGLNRLKNLLHQENGRLWPHPAQNAHAPHQAVSPCCRAATALRM